MPSPTNLIELPTAFAGRMLRPGDSEYGEARRLHNGLVDQHPAVIVQRSRYVAGGTIPPDGRPPTAA
jgi:hypothetical protein